MRSSRFIRAARSAAPAWARSAIVLAVILGACAEPTAPRAPTVAPRADPASYDVGVQSTPYGSEYTWSQGQPATNMGTDKGGFGFPRVCYLTRVSGKFAGNNQSIGVYLYGNTWFLSGISNSAGVGGRARCMLMKSFTGEYTWSSGSSSLTITKPSLVACFITAIGGEFYKFDHVTLQRWPNTTNWSLGGYGGDGNTTAINARARCAQTIQGNNADVATGSWSGTDYTWLAPNSGTVCVLTEVGGSLQSASSYVAIYKHASSWLMVGSPASSPNSPNATSHCYS